MVDFFFFSYLYTGYRRNRSKIYQLQHQCGNYYCQYKQVRKKNTRIINQTNIRFLKEKLSKRQSFIKKRHYLSKKKVIYFSTEEMKVADEDTVVPLPIGEISITVLDDR